MQKLLYCACGHPLQEYDDCLTWESLGLDWFSTGAYAYEDKPGDLGFIKSISNEKRQSFYHGLNFCKKSDNDESLCGKKNLTWTGRNISNLLIFKKEFLDQFDIIIFTHFIDNYFRNKEFLNGQKIIFKSFGMHPLSDEIQIQKAKADGVIIVRNAPTELYRCQGLHDYVIRNSVVKNIEELSGWNGDINKVLTFCSFFNHDIKRKQYYHTTIKKSYCSAELYGSDTNFISHEQKVEKLKSFRSNLVIGTPNANNTYSFVEAWVMGQPVVVFGPKLWRSPRIEPQILIQHGVNGFISDNILICADFLRKLSLDHNLARDIGSKGREDAIKIYSREVIAEQWKQVL